MKTNEVPIGSNTLGVGSMQKMMTHWGVGPRLGICVLPYCAVIIGLSLYLNPFFNMGFIPYWILGSVGTFLILAGIPFYMISLSTVMRAFKAGRLVTTGVYGMCRHPVYASWIVFFIPGIALLLNNWAALTVSVVMYLFLRVLIKDEDIYLEETFGNEYLTYKKRVPPVMPAGLVKSIFT